MSLVKDPNVQFVRVRQDLFALAIMSNFFPILISFCPTKCDLSSTGGANFLLTKWVSFWAQNLKLWVKDNIL